MAAHHGTDTAGGGLGSGYAEITVPPHGLDTDCGPISFLRPVPPDRLPPASADE